MVTVARRMTCHAMVFSLVMIINAGLYAQVSKDLRFILDRTPAPEPFTESPPAHVFFETSEAKILTLGILRGYQVFVSSQQNNLRVCTFLPSCSNFSIAAIKQYNLFKGLLLSADRLQRCHVHNRYFYLLHYDTGKRLDPPEYYIPFTDIKREF